jgi:hypothetical protein
VESTSGKISGVVSMITPRTSMVTLEEEQSARFFSGGETESRLIFTRIAEKKNKLHRNFEKQKKSEKNLFLFSCSFFHVHVLVLVISKSALPSNCHWSQSPLVKELYKCAKMLSLLFAVSDTGEGKGGGIER